MEMNENEKKINMVISDILWKNGISVEKIKNIIYEIETELPKILESKNKFKKCKCGSKNFKGLKTKNHTGLYCKDCGKWQKWLNKDDINYCRLNKIEMEEN